MFLYFCNMKKLLFFFLFFCCAIAARGQVWHDASSMHIFGKAVENTLTHFSRLPEDIHASARKEIQRLGKNAAGLYVEFRTDSPSIHVRWTSLRKHTMPHMASVGSRGVDLYAHTDKGWRFVSCGRPDLDNEVTSRCIVKKMDAGYKHFRLYLSLYDGITSLEIGTDPGSEFIPVDCDKREAPLVMYGSSILQGGCVSRPGIASTNIIGRALGREVVNLGFSGNALLDPEVAELMARVENPALFVLDNVPNDKAQLILDKGEAFVKILRDAHPDVPIIMMEMAHYGHDFVSSSSYADVEARNAAQREIYDRLVAAGEKNIYFLGSDDLIGHDGEATVDGTHQTDLGQMRYAEFFLSFLEKNGINL